MQKVLIIRLFAAFLFVCAQYCSSSVKAGGAPLETNSPAIQAASSTASALAAANSATNHSSNTGVIDAENREFRAGDVFRYWIEEDPNNRNSDGVQVRVTSAGKMLCPVSSGYQPYVTVDCIGKKLAAIREDVKKQLEEKYYYHAEVHLDLDAILKGQDATGAGSGGTAVVFGEMSGKIPLPEGQKVFLSQALATMHPGEWADLSTVKVNRKNGKTLTIDVKKILAKNLRANDVELQDGDMIEVRAVGWHF